MVTQQRISNPMARVLALPPARFIYLDITTDTTLEAVPWELRGGVWRPDLPQGVWEGWGEVQFDLGSPPEALWLAFEGDGLASVRVRGVTHRVAVRGGRFRHQVQG
jgi:hypothetical protein